MTVHSPVCVLNAHASNHYTSFPVWPDILSVQWLVVSFLTWHSLHGKPATRAATSRFIAIMSQHWLVYRMFGGIARNFFRVDCIFFNTMIYWISVLGADFAYNLCPCANSRSLRFANSALKQCSGTADYMQNLLCNACCKTKTLKNWNDGLHKMLSKLSLCRNMRFS